MKGSVTSEARYDSASAANGAARDSPNSAPPSAGPASCATLVRASFWLIAVGRWEGWTSNGSAERSARLKKMVALPSANPARRICT